MKRKIRNFFAQLRLENAMLSEHNKNKPDTPLLNKVEKVVGLVTLAIWLVIFIVSCPINASAADEPTESDLVDIPSGVYIAKPLPDIDTLVSLGSQTYSLPEGFISYSSVQTYASGPYDLYTNQPLTNLWIVVNDNSIGNLIGFCSNSFGNYAFAWDPTLGYNNIIMALSNGDINNPNSAFASVPIVSVPSDVSLNADIASAFNSIFYSVGSGSGTPQECPTVGELLSNMSGTNAYEALITNNPDANSIILDMLDERYNEGILAGSEQGFIDGTEYGYTLGYNDAANDMSDTYVGDIVGGVFDALDRFTIFGEFSILDLIKTIVGIFAVVWLLKLLAGG